MHSEVSTQLIGLWIGVMSFLGWTPEAHPLLFPKHIPEQITDTKIDTEKITQTKEKSFEENMPKKENIDLKKIPEKKVNKPETVKEKIKTPHMPTIEDVVINIYCTVRKGNKIETISGSAVRLKENIYLTNAHVAKHIMLENYFIKKSSTDSVSQTHSCKLRELSPADGSGSAEIIFLPTSWVQKNKTNLKQLNPKGDGSHDYALFREIKKENGNLETTVALPLTRDTVEQDQEVFLIGYPIFDQGSIKNNLRKVSEKVTVKKLFSFEGRKIDTFNTEKTTLAHVGSSGGAVITTEGELLGIMVATVENTTSNTKEIKAIGLDYIQRNIFKESGKSLETFLKDTDQEVLSFRDNYLEALSEILLEGSK